MDRPPISPSERQRSGGSQYVQLDGNFGGDTILSDAPDTDLCLSMVNETRPSYQMKTFGKTPLTAPHLMSLVDSSEIPKGSSQSPKVSPYSASSQMSYSAAMSSSSTVQQIQQRPALSPYSKYKTTFNYSNQH